MDSKSNSSENLQLSNTANQPSTMATVHNGTVRDNSYNFRSINYDVTNYWLSSSCNQTRIEDEINQSKTACKSAEKMILISYLNRLCLPDEDYLAIINQVLSENLNTISLRNERKSDPSLSTKDELTSHHNTNFASNFDLPKYADSLKKDFLEMLLLQKAASAFSGNTNSAQNFFTSYTTKTYPVPYNLFLNSICKDSRLADSADKRVGNTSLTFLNSLNTLYNPYVTSSNSNMGIWNRDANLSLFSNTCTKSVLSPSAPGPVQSQRKTYSNSCYAGVVSANSTFFQGANNDNRSNVPAAFNSLKYTACSFNDNRAFYGNQAVSAPSTIISNEETLPVFSIVNQVPGSFHSVNRPVRTESVSCPSTPNPVRNRTSSDSNYTGVVSPNFAQHVNNFPSSVSNIYNNQTVLAASTSTKKAQSFSTQSPTASYSNTENAASSNYSVNIPATFYSFSNSQVISLNAVAEPLTKSVSNNADVSHTAAPSFRRNSNRSSKTMVASNDFTPSCGFSMNFDVLRYYRSQDSHLQKSLICEEHENAAVFFCKNCVLAICYLCESHRTHSSLDLINAQEAICEEIKNRALNEYTSKRNILKIINDALQNAKSNEVNDINLILQCSTKAEWGKRYRVTSNVQNIYRLLKYYLMMQKDLVNSCLEALETILHYCQREIPFPIEKTYYELKTLEKLLRSSNFEVPRVRFAHGYSVPFSIEHCEEIVLNFPWSKKIIRLNRNSLIMFRELFRDYKTLGRPIYGAEHDVLVTSLENIQAFSFGSYGEKEGQLNRPWGVCCNKTGHIIVSDRSNHRIQVFTNSGEFSHAFGQFGTDLGHFHCPTGITVNQDDEIIVADKDNHRIQVFQMNGTFVRHFGSEGNQTGQFNFPWDVTCNIQGDIAVADSKNCRVQLFNKFGQFIAFFKIAFKNFSFSSVKDQHSYPRGVSFTPDGRLVVTDFNLKQIYIIDKHWRQIQQLIRNKKERNLISQFSRLSGVICDDAGNIIVSDTNNNSIVVMTADGKFVKSFGSLGENLKQFNKPSGICLDPKGNIIVVDFKNARIQVFGSIDTINRNF